MAAVYCFSCFKQYERKARLLEVEAKSYFEARQLLRKELGNDLRQYTVRFVKREDDE